MCNTIHRVLSGVVLGAVLSLVAQAETMKMGKVSFLAKTNVGMFSFGGDASDIQSKIVLNGTDLSSLEIRIPVTSLKTGMEIRDKHMRERIFTAPDGSTPDIVFSGKDSHCVPVKAGKNRSCTVDGTLAFRGQVHPFPLEVTLKDGSEVQGHALVNVLEYGVDPKALAWTEIVVDKNAVVDFDVSLHP